MGGICFSGGYPAAGNDREGMLKSKKFLAVLLVSVILPGGLLFAGKPAAWAAADESSLVREKLATLRAAAEKFAQAYAKRKYKIMYELVNPQYRKRVPLWEYKDFVDYPGVTDGYIEVKVADVSVLPKSDYKYGKVMLQIIMVETEKNKTTGKIRKIEDEKWEFQDWVQIKGNWYKIEKLDSN